MQSKKLLVAASAFAVMAGISAAKAEVKIGVEMAVTGPIPDLVAPMVEMAQLAADEINKQGGVLGQKLVTPVVDGQCNAQAAVDAGEKLVNVEQVTAILGEVCSGATIGLAETVTIPAGVTIVSPSATAPAITDLKDKDLVFRTAASDAYQGSAIAQYAISNGIKKVALTYANDDYNVGIANVFRASFEALGGEIVADQVHEPEKSSYRAELATLATSGVDTLAIFAYYNSGGNVIVRQSLEGGQFKNFFGADGMAAQEMVDSVGAANLRGNSWWTANTTEAKGAAFAAFADLLKNAGSDLDPAGPYHASSYDAMFLLALAIEANGTKDREGLNAKLRYVASAPGEVVLPGEWKRAVSLLKAGKDINYEGAAGSHDFDSAGDVQGVYSVSVVDEDGKLSSIKTIR